MANGWSLVAGNGGTVALVTTQAYLFISLLFLYIFCYTSVFTSFASVFLHVDNDDDDFKDTQELTLNS